MKTVNEMSNSHICHAVKIDSPFKRAFCQSIIIYYYIYWRGKQNSVST